jgi:dihydrofolate reductase
MGKVVVTEFVSLDGVIEDPGGAEGTEFGGWTFRFPADEGQAFKFEELMAADAHLLGRVTYQEFAASWPAMEDTTGEFGVKMNAMPKVVVSTTLTNPTWKNSTVVTGHDLPGVVANLKKTYDGDILVAGSATLVESLREHDLIDEYRLMVHPVVLGRGKKLFKDGSTAADLTLVETRKAGPDVLLLIYHPANRTT